MNKKLTQMQDDLNILKGNTTSVKGEERVGYEFIN